MKSNEIRFYIQIRFKLGIEPKDILNELKTAISDHAPSLKTIYNWISAFKKNPHSIEDKPRAGRPITAVTTQNIAIVKDLIEDNPSISYDQMIAQTSLSNGSLTTILHKHLYVRKLTSRWIPHLLSDDSKKIRVALCNENLQKFNENKWRLGDIITGDESWFYLRNIKKKETNKSWVKKGEEARTVVRRGRFESKFMFTIFLRRFGPVLITYLDRGKTVDSQTYIENCLQPIVTYLNKQRKSTGAKNIKIHHDNARPHIHSTIVNNF